MLKNTSILLGSHFENFISSEVASGKYDSASEVVWAALRLLELDELKTKHLLKEMELGEQSSMQEEFSWENNLQRLCKKNLWWIIE